MLENSIFKCPCAENPNVGSCRVKFALLFEGTANDESNPSAITKLSNMFCDIREQRKHIVSGSGTRGEILKKLICRITGWDTYQIVFEQFRWLTREALRQQLRPEQIDLYLFGFSRGAYQARLFAEMISTMGIPPNESCCKCVVARFAIGRLCGWFKKRTGFGLPVVKYLGVIDTVRAVLFWLTGVKSPQIPYGTHVRHALAKHEARLFFRKLVIYNAEHTEQRFFLGSHGDVGWSYNGPKGTNSLGEIALNWIIEGLSGDLKFMYSPPNPISSPGLKLMLVRNMWWIMHESGKGLPNLFGFIPLRSRGQYGVKLHSTARMVREIVKHFPLFERKESLWIRRSLGCQPAWFWRFLRLEDDRETINRRMEEQRPAIINFIVSKGF